MRATECQSFMATETKFGAQPQPQPQRPEVLAPEGAKSMFGACAGGYLAEKELERPAGSAPASPARPRRARAPKKKK